MSNYDFVILHLTTWDSGYQSSGVTYAKEFSKNHRVILIDRPLTIFDYWRLRKDPKFKDKCRAALTGKNYIQLLDLDGFKFYAVTPALTFSINFINSPWLYNLANKINHFFFNRTFNRMLKDLDVKHYVVMNSFNPFLMNPFPKLDVEPIVKFYRCVDEIGEDAYIKKHGIRLENEAVKNYDFSIATSTPLVNKLLKQDEKVFLVSNGADTAHFSKAYSEKYDEPEDLKIRPGKRILFVGNIGAARVDFQLLKDLALARPDYQLVMIGPFVEREIKTFGLNDIPNIYFAGQRKMGVLPAYLQHCNVTIIPYLINKLTSSIYPLKINEYLAAGKPVVSTSFSEEVKSFAESAYLANDTEEFIACVDKALAEDNEILIQKRMEVAASNKWENRVEKIKALMRRFNKTSFEL